MKREVFRNNSGISLVSIIITIIVVIILAAISIKGLDSRQNAAHAKYVQEFEELRKGVETKRLSNSKNGIENADNGFYRVYVSGDIPYNFMSIGNGEEKIAYLVSLDFIGYDDMSTGRAYREFEAGAEEDLKTVTFGEDDAYVYDSTGRLFYAKGFPHGDEILHEVEPDDGQIYIVKIEKELNPEKTETKVTITIESEKEIDSVRVKNKDDFDEEATEIGEGIYEIIIEENGNYEVTAKDVEDNQDKDDFVVTGIGANQIPTVTARVTNGVEEAGVYKIDELIAYIEVESATAKYMHISTSNVMPEEDVWLPFSTHAQRYFADAGEKTLYVWVKDENGNICEMPYELKILIELKTPAIETPDLVEVSGEINFEITPDNTVWSKSKRVKITFSEGKQSNGYRSEYSINGGRWTATYTPEVLIDVATEGAVISARITYSSVYQNEIAAQGSVTVTKIDREPPTIRYFRVDTTGRYLEVDAIDAKSGLYKDAMGIEKAYIITTDFIEFKYLTDEEINSKPWSTEKTLAITKDARYYVYVRDAAGNISSTSITAEAPDLTPPTVTSSAQSILDYAVITAIARDDTGVVAYGLTKEDHSNPPTEWVEISEEEYIVIEYNNIREDGNYVVWAKDHAGNIGSGEITNVRLFQFPVLDDNYPQSLYVKEGSEVSMEIRVVTPGYPTEYEPQWHVSKDGGETWTPIAVATADKYDFTALYEYNNNLYKCVINHARGVMESKVAKLEVIRITKDKPSADIETETELVLGGVIINKGAVTTSSTTLTIDVYAVNAAEMCISENGTMGEWITYEPSTTYTLTNTTNGDKTITVWVRNNDGTEVSASMSSKIKLDRR